MSKRKKGKRMARKLNPEEVAILMESADQSESSPSEMATRNLKAQHDTALSLSPESGAWFGVEIPAWFKV
jgi:hypothetical protein